MFKKIALFISFLFNFSFAQNLDLNLILKAMVLKLKNLDNTTKKIQFQLEFLTKNIEDVKKSIKVLKEKESKNENRLKKIQEKLEKQESKKKRENKSDVVYYYLVNSKGEIGVAKKEALIDIFKEAVKRNYHLVALKIFKNKIDLKRLKKEKNKIKYCYYQFAFFRKKKHTYELSCYMSLDDISNIKIEKDWGAVLPKY